MVPYLKTTPRFVANAKDIGIHTVMDKSTSDLYEDNQLDKTIEMLSTDLGIFDFSIFFS